MKESNKEVTKIVSLIKNCGESIRVAFECASYSQVFFPWILDLVGTRH